MRYLSEIFLRDFWDLGALVKNSSDFLVSVSVCYSAHFLTEIRQVKGYLQFWMICFSENFFGDITGKYAGNVRSGLIRSACLHKALNLNLWSYYVYCCT